MRNIFCYLLVAGTCVLATQTASAQAIESWTGGSEFAIYYGGSTGDVVGYRFEVTSSVSVDSLGVWNGDSFGAGGLDSDHQVGIWDSTMTLIASTTVTPTSTVLGEFRYEAITPVALSVGPVYTIGALYTSTDDDGYISSASGLVTAPQVTWINAVYPSTGSLGFVFPTLDSAPNSQGRFGPNFTFSCQPPVPASETPRVGTPPNPNAFLPGVTSGPILGATWDPVIDHTTFAVGAVADFAAISLVGPTNVPTGLGTVLISPPYELPIRISTPPGTPFAILIPADCAFAGLPAWTQGGSWSPSVGIELANALDIVLGTF